MWGEYVQIILQKRNAKTIAIPWLSSAINISIVIMVIMHKRKHKVSEWLNVSFFFLFYFTLFQFFIAANWASWWTASREETGSPLFPVQPCSSKKLMKEKNIMALQPR